MSPDIIIVAVFIIVLFYASCRKASNIENINVFALGKRSFSTFALVSTITATWVSGSGFFIILTKFYTDGWEYLLPTIGMSGSLLIVAFVIAPKMKRFLGKTSTAAIMGEEYGQKVRVITALSGAIGLSGSIAVQFKVFGDLGVYLFDCDPSWTLLCSGLIVIAYSTIGGIGSVVRTDIIQAILFFLAITIAIVTLYPRVYAPDIPPISSDLLKKFSITSLLDLSSDKLISMTLLTLYFVIPSMNPATTQRISMGFSVKQAKSSWAISSLLVALVKISSAYIVYLLFQLSPNLGSHEILPFLINSFTIPGTKVIVFLGVIAMAMSTADSHLNVASILLANDTYKANRMSEQRKLHLARWASVVIGIFSLYLSFSKQDLLSIILFSNSFYMPIVTVPLLAAVFGYKTTELTCLVAMSVAFIFVCTCHFIIHTSFDPLVPAMVINAFALFVSHYLIDKKKILKRFGITSKLKEIKNV